MAKAAVWTKAQSLVLFTQSLVGRREEKEEKEREREEEKNLQMAIRCLWDLFD